MNDIITPSIQKNKTKKTRKKKTTITYKFLKGQHSLYQFSGSAGRVDIGQL